MNLLQIDWDEYLRLCTESDNLYKEQKELLAKAEKIGIEAKILSDKASEVWLFILDIKIPGIKNETSIGD